jgi:hypothetical protein
MNNDIFCRISDVFSVFAIQLMLPVHNGPLKGRFLRLRIRLCRFNETEQDNTCKRKNWGAPQKSPGCDPVAF